MRTVPFRAHARSFSNGIFIALFGYIALVILVDRITPQYFRLDAYAAMAPLVAAALCSFRQAVIIAAVDFLAVVVLSGWVPDDPHNVNRISTVVGNALLAGASIMVAWLMRERDGLLHRLLVTGEAAQRALLRQLPLRSHDVTVDGFYVSSQQDALVGGDIYEVVETPYGTRVLIGDVQGKGLRTLGAGAAVLTAFREAAYYRRGLEGGVVAMEQGLRRYVSSSAGDTESTAGGELDRERFVTALVFGVDQTAAVPDERAVPLSFVACGHLAPYLIQSDGTVRELEPEEPGLPLGLGELVSRPRAVQHITVPADARVFTCTDGVTEARGPGGEFYPLADRLGGWARLPTPELLARLQEDLELHTGGRLQDDAAALVMERTAPAPDPTADPGATAGADGDAGSTRADPGHRPTGRLRRGAGR
ncbi:PP2C family protein-serine/threonine phosphatase [Streptomyces palmae]|uniref:Serine/threonine-protein phosphatase n=1 Tax=Streptomyces palmae TaxID=1701085 RepID=A0A4Z0HGL9_9ACTN|nr:PP2C family protein-serine/threonine phosphatase [Streptomyces palmae]TGB18476.1 serine/threonine-protein phosphatase [Streptomyces palmae]